VRSVGLRKKLEGGEKGRAEMGSISAEDRKSYWKRGDRNLNTKTDREKKFGGQLARREV